MRDIKRIILHCTATYERQSVTIEDVRRWHTSAPRNWKDVGYHYLILQDGTIEHGRNVQVQGAHVKGENVDSIGIAYCGGLLENGDVADTMTSYQDMSFLMLVNSLRNVFGHLTLHGHNEFSNKACPGFDVQDKYSFLLDA